MTEEEILIQSSSHNPHRPDLSDQPVPSTQELQQQLNASLVMHLNKVQKNFKKPKRNIVKNASGVKLLRNKSTKAFFAKAFFANQASHLSSHLIPPSRPFNGLLKIRRFHDKIRRFHDILKHLRMPRMIHRSRNLLIIRQSNLFILSDLYLLRATFNPEFTFCASLFRFNYRIWGSAS